MFNTRRDVLRAVISSEPGYNEVMRERRRPSHNDMPKHPPRSVEELTRRNVEAIAKMEAESQVHRTLGDRVADGFAAVAGSWTFIIVQSVVLAAWIVLN